MPALLFHLVCLFVDLYVGHRGVCVYVNSRIKSKHYCSCRYPPLGISHRIQTMRGGDGGGESGAEEWAKDGMEGPEGDTGGKRDGENEGGGVDKAVCFGAFRSQCYLMKMK